MPIKLITRPAAEPVTLADLKSQLGLSPAQDTDQLQSDLLSKRLRRLLAAARAECENLTRRVFVTQTWQQRLNNWPHRDPRYDEHFSTPLVLPKPPFQSVSSFTYVDTQGNPQDMFAYGFQVDNGSETQPGYLTPPFAQPWPPLRMVPSNVQVTFRCGYGGPVTVSTSPAAAVLSTPAWAWNLGDVGMPISIPGAGVAGTTFATSIASVTAGVATLTAATTTAVTSATAYAGEPVPETITNAILFLAQFYEENGAIASAETPKQVLNALRPYMHYVS
jgi:uncharacterized phiE125 gp8 family phage protein